MIINDASTAISKTLMSQWDPIGVGGNPKLKDEYDPYIDPVMKLVSSSGSAEEISAFLTAVERDQMGLVPDTSRALRVAKSLLKLAGR